LSQIYLILVLQAPIISYGKEAIDRIRPTDIIPSKSMLTGLLGNAMGYSRKDAEQLTQLQNRIHFAARTEQISADYLIQDFHTAQIETGEEAWTTYGIIEKRGGSNYQNEMREVYYLTESRTVIALKLDDPEH